MKQLDLNENISTFERGTRAVLSAAFIGAVLAAPHAAPAGLALIALYPAFTALLGWDPAYAMFSKLAASRRETMTGQPIRVGIRNTHAVGRAR